MAEQLLELMKDCILRGRGKSDLKPDKINSCSDILVWLGDSEDKQEEGFLNRQRERTVPATRHEILSIDLRARGVEIV